MNNNSSVNTSHIESVRARYVATLASQFIQLVASLASAGILPRALGAAAYGNYNFLLTTASTLRGFLEPSASPAFFTFSSQDRRSGPLTKLYALVMFVQILIVIFGIGLLAFIGRLNWLWAGQTLDQILLVTVLEWILFLTAMLRQLGDSKGLTVHVQVLSIATSLINVIGLLSLNAFGFLNIYTYIFLNMFSVVLIAIALGYWLLFKNADLTWNGELRGRTKEYLMRWWRFAAPLIVLEYYSPLVGYMGAYLLQQWYGSVQQGYFALASKWSAFVLVFTSSALMIFWREIANATANGDWSSATRTYVRFTRLLFFLALVLCTWLSFSSGFLVRILVGEQYNLAIPVLSVMAYYPLAQTYGQVNTAALKASEKTVIVRNLGFVFSIPGLVVTYLLLAPPSALIPGLGLGALGIAIRMVGYDLLSVQAYEWMSHRTFGLNYFNTLVQKFYMLLVVFICAGLTLYWLVNMLANTEVPLIWMFCISSSAYFALIAAVTLINPDLAGLSRTDISDNLKKGRALILKSFNGAKKE